MEEPAVHRADERIAIRRRSRDRDRFHSIEQLHDLFRVERVLPWMDDRPHVRTRSGETAIDQVLELRDLRRRLAHISLRTSREAGAQRGADRQAPRPPPPGGRTPPRRPSPPLLTDAARATPG